MKTQTTMEKVVTSKSLKTNIGKLLIALSCAALVGGLSTVAQAQDCTAFAQSIVNGFGKIPQKYEGVMQVALATNRSDGNFVSYGEMPSESGNNGGSGQFVYNPGGNGLPPSLSGTLAVFYSDRRFNQVGGLGGGTSDPFNPGATDALALTIWLGSYPPYGITPGLVSWGGNNSFQGQCQDKMIYGFYQNTTALVLSLFKQGLVYTGTIP